MLLAASERYLSKPAHGNMGNYLVPAKSAAYLAMKMFFKTMPSKKVARQSYRVKKETFAVTTCFDSYSGFIRGIRLLLKIFRSLKTSSQTFASVRQLCLRFCCPRDRNSNNLLSLRVRSCTRDFFKNFFALLIILSHQ